MVSCTAIKTQVVFETLFVLVTSQLAIVSQLGAEVYPQRIRLFLDGNGILDLIRNLLVIVVVQNTIPPI